MSAISRDIPSSYIPVQTNLETVWTHAHICHKSFVFGVCYHPPNNCSNFAAHLHDAIDIIIAHHPNAFIFLLEDNFPNIPWSSDPPDFETVFTRKL